MKLNLKKCLLLLSLSLLGGCASLEKSQHTYPHPHGDGIVTEYKNYPLPTKCIELNAAGCYTVEFTNSGTKWGIYWLSQYDYAVEHERAHVWYSMMHGPYVNKCMRVTQSGGKYLKGDRWCVHPQGYEVLVERNK